jgi:transcriptional regulator with XRE-family HTH domain
MRTKGWEERLRELDEAATAIKVGRRAARIQQGWLRTVRRAVGIPAAEAAGRIGVVLSALYRMEIAEGRGVIELGTLRRAAEALGCELVYGLAPKAGTLTEMAVAIEAAGARRRDEAWAWKLQKAKDKRYEAAKARWEERQRERLGEGWREYWRLGDSAGEARRVVPKAVKETPFWKERMRKGLKKALRKKGIRSR